MVCGQAVAERDAEYLAHALQYTDAEIIVEVVSKESLQEAPSKALSLRSFQKVRFGTVQNFSNRSYARAMQRNFTAIGISIITASNE